MTVPALNFDRVQARFQDTVDFLVSFFMENVMRKMGCNKISLNLGSNCDKSSKIEITNGTQTLHVADNTWHNNNRLDGFMDELNALFFKYNLN